MRMALLLSLSGLAACSSGTTTTADGGRDLGAPDGSAADAAGDAGRRTDGAADSGSSDLGSADSGAADLGASETDPPGHLFRERAA